MNTIRFETITDLIRRLGLEAPAHPLITLVNYDEVTVDLRDAGNWIVLDFYKVTFKKDFTGSVKYGPGTYDYQEGGMAFLAPGQAVQLTAELDNFNGYALYFHPDLLTGHSLAQGIHHYGFFDYSVAEALFLSSKEKSTMEGLFQAIHTELENKIDQFSHQVLLSQLDLLLNHSDRFYNRQFQTRKNIHHELILKMDKWLADRFNNAIVSGPPSPKDIAAHLNVSQRYLSDMLRSITGKTTQQHIHLALIERAKSLLDQTDLTTAEIAYQLGFEHPQSFNKLFKQRTNMSPVRYRRDQLREN
ncbi:helix-turn-helix transcriptional regulator [Mucilaginibacter daejeonensis]|uniref:helix-turn-helix domain-containing protein n=1 Tax=Mucilaginibacter daejeonensis TaxID=398049 RepID=UPI001D172A22|nr:response regulator transcription factor [Mucilaginibacter daejeonensis]UEG52143.1 helix-turn-helix transcriptional regulator [Mucilaginibacter daejeonensis]